MKNTVLFFLVVFLSVAMGITGLAWAAERERVILEAPPRPYTPEYPRVRLLPPPSPPKKVFVTSQVYNGNLGGMPGADLICQQLARNAGLTGTYKPWLAGYTGLGTVTGPLQTFNRSNGPYIRVDGVVVASDFNALMNNPHTLLTSICLTETGQFVGNAANVLVWSGILPGVDNATGAPTLAQYVGCDNWTNSSFPTSSSGRHFYTDVCGWVGNLEKFWFWEWTWFSETTANCPIPGIFLGMISCDQAARLYCFEQ